MSSITNVTRTLNVKPAAVLTLVLAIIAVLANPSGPLGGFWRPAADMHAPMGAELPFAILLKIAEGLTFGLGISFLVFGYPTVRAISPASGRLTRAAHLSIAWLLFSWWPHDSLHIHNGMNVGGLLAIEYAFHITLMIAGIILARFFLTLVQRPA
jgi:energy-coupling factor transporter transmembrane protein EcfT